MKFIVALYCLVVCQIHLFGQENNKYSSTDFTQDKPIAFRHLTIDNGLSQNTILSIAQDSIGYMWFATQNELNKYNGKSIKQYKKRFKNVTRSTFSHLGKVYVDKQNQLWIISGNGVLEKYLPKTDDFKIVKTDYLINTIYQDQSLNIYLGTYNNGIYKIDSKTKDTTQLLNSSDNTITAFHFMQDGNAIYVASSKGLLSLNKDNTYRFLNTNIPDNTNVSYIAKNKSNTLFVGTYGNGLYYKSSTTHTFLKLTKLGAYSLPDNLNIEALLFDKKDRLWVATYGNGLYVLDFTNKIIQQFKAQKDNPFAVHYNDILCLFQDSTGNIWLGTDGAGSSYFDEHLVKFNLLTNKQLPEGVNVDVIRSIVTDNLNNIWIGTSGHGLTYIDLQSNNHYTITSSNSNINSNRIVSLAYIDEVLWVGHQNSGLNILSKNNFTSFNELQSKTIWKILPVNKERAWLATERSGVILFDINKGIIKSYNKDNSALASNNIRTINRPNDETLWLGSIEDGLYNIHLKTDKVEKIPNINDYVKAIYIENDIVWIGTSGNGLKRLNTKTNKVSVFNMQDGLPNDVVYSVLPDKNGNLWLSTNYGLCKFTYNETKAPEIENYTNLNGLQGLEFNTGAYFVDENGVLYFGGLDGINWFIPDQITKNTIKPETVLTNVEVFNKPIDFTENIELPFNQNTITFTFSALHFSQPERNFYRYKLVNNDADWIESGNENVAHYTNLPPNDYEFQVYSSNYDGIWDETPSILPFTIKQPWYLNNLAKSIYILLFLLTSLAVYRYLKWRWQIKMQLQLEQNEAERLKKLDEYKTKLYTNISHEFRTPLTLISGPVNKQLSKPDISEEVKADLSLVQQNSQRLLNLVNQLLDLSKIESGSLKLKVSEGNLKLLLKQLASSFKYKAKDRNINFNVSISHIDTAWFDKDVIEKIVTNLLSNAIKYAPNNGRVAFNAIEKNGQLIITVVNNGNTFKDKELAKLFQRFYRGNTTKDGVGIGLSLVKELTILSHGNIVANTMNKDDIQFTVTIPIDRSFYNQSEIIYKEEQLTNQYFNQEADKISSEEDSVLLIVDDEKDIRQFIASIFKDNYAIIQAANGKEAMNLAIKHIPDLVISDIMMPKVDGITFCNNLKHNEKTSHIPIILLTAKVGSENEIQGLKTGANDYITKPFNNETLKLKVDKLIKLRKQLQEQYIQTFEIASKNITISSTEQKFLERLKEVLDEYVTNPEFSTEQFSDKMLMSRMQLHRKIKAVTGLSTSEFLRKERLKIGAKLLIKSDATVSEIAYQIGFNTPSYFIKSFKEEFNCTPSDYKTQNTSY